MANGHPGWGGGGITGAGTMGGGVSHGHEADQTAHGPFGTVLPRSICWRDLMREVIFYER